MTKILCKIVRLNTDDRETYVPVSHDDIAFIYSCWSHTVHPLRFHP